ncbi:MAG: hypothetical protein AB7O97_02010 [Planctomycetota bacterium]
MIEIAQDQRELIQHFDELGYLRASHDRLGLSNAEESIRRKSREGSATLAGDPRLLPDRFS